MFERCSLDTTFPTRFPRVFQSFREKYFLYLLSGGCLKKEKEEDPLFPNFSPCVPRVNIISKYWSWRIVPFLWSIFFDIYLVSFYPIKYLISCYTLIFNLNQIYVPFSRKIIICYAKFFFFSLVKLMKRDIYDKFIF